ncbi:hypothetical protein CKA32_006796 [Geitlerinema sp. FC II]|nr:hypothetical protein CKA32_006796 [Geitlerinema sp. FC II]
MSPSGVEASEVEALSLLFIQLSENSYSVKNSAISCRVTSEEPFN